MTYFVSCGLHSLICPSLERDMSYLEPASGTLRSTRRYRSSQTLPHSSGGDTFLHPPAHEERTEMSGSRNNIVLQPARPVISPEIQAPLDTGDTLLCTAVQRTHRTLTFSVHMSTHFSTDMFWMTALKGRANVTLSGRWKHPLKMALPSETDRTNLNVTHHHNKNSFHQLGLCPLTLHAQIPPGLPQCLMRS